MTDAEVDRLATTPSGAAVADQTPYRPPAFLVTVLLFAVANCFSANASLPLPVGPDRIFFGLTVLLVLIDARTEWHRLRLGAATWAAVATTLWVLLSARVNGTLTTSVGAFALLDRIVVPYALFVLAPVLFGTKESRVLLLKVLCVLGIYLGATAIFENAGLNALVFPRYIVDPNVGISVGRARGPFLASDADAAVMGMCVFAAGALFVLTASKVWRTLSVISVLLSLAGVLLCLTRAEWIGTGVAIVVVSLAVPTLRRKLPAAVLGVAVAISIALIASSSLRDSVSTRASNVRSVYDRQNTNSGGLRALEQHPLAGIGWDRFVFDTTRFVRQASDYPLTNTNIEIHNVVISRFAETGLIGGFLWILSVVFGLIAASFRSRRPFLIDETMRLTSMGITIVWLIAVQFSPFPYPLPNSLVWLVAGIAGSPLQVGPRTTRLKQRNVRADPPSRA